MHVNVPKSTLASIVFVQAAQGKSEGDANRLDKGGFETFVFNLARGTEAKNVWKEYVCVCMCIPIFVQLEESANTAKDLPSKAWVDHRAF